MVKTGAEGGSTERGKSSRRKQLQLHIWRDFSCWSRGGEAEKKKTQVGESKRMKSDQNLVHRSFTGQGRTWGQTAVLRGTPCGTKKGTLRGRHSPHKKHIVRRQKGGPPVRRPGVSKGDHYKRVTTKRKEGGEKKGLLEMRMHGFESQVVYKKWKKKNRKKTNQQRGGDQVEDGRTRATWCAWPVRKTGARAGQT